MVWPKPVPGQKIQKITVNPKIRKIVLDHHNIRYEDPKKHFTKWICLASPKNLRYSQKWTVAPKSRSRRLQDEDNYRILNVIQSDLSHGQSHDAVHKEPSEAADATPEDLRSGSKDLTRAELPLSPLMDPQLIKARRRFKEPKPLPTKELNELQGQINQNAYAHLLASPVRVCTLTGVRLPNAFLIPFTLKKDQRTGRLWQVPNLNNGPKEANDMSPPSSPNDELSQTPLQNLSSRLLSPQSLKDNGSFAVAKPFPTPPRVSIAWVTAQYSAIAHIAYLSRHVRRDYFRTIPFRWKDTFGQSLKDVVFREDMAEFVLSLLRKRVLELLVNNFDVSTASGRVEICRAVVRPHSFIAVLWFPESAHVPGEAEERDANSLESRPPPYTAFRGVEGLVPIFNLREMLGREELDQLRKLRCEAAAVRNPALPFKDVVSRTRMREVSRQLVGTLWLLRRYLETEEVVGEDIATTWDVKEQNRGEQT